jgi:hypothetical protein
MSNRPPSIPVEIAPEGFFADLWRSPHPKDLIIVAVEKGHDRHSVRSRTLADLLSVSGHTCLLIDSGDAQELAGELKADFPDTDLMIRRMAQAVAWAKNDHALGCLPFVVMGTGATAEAVERLAAGDPSIEAIISVGAPAPPHSGHGDVSSGDDLISGAERQSASCPPTMHADRQAGFLGPRPITIRIASDLMSAEDIASEADRFLAGRLHERPSANAT